MARLLFSGDLLADYHQIYLCDETVETLPDDYSAAAIARRLVVAPHAAVIHTARNMPTPVVVEWLDARPSPDPGAFQHVAEAGFSCPSGVLIVAGLTDYQPNAARIAVPAGPLGLRACFSGLDTIDASGLEGDDRYLLQLWAGEEPADVRVLRQWPAP